VYYIHRNPEKHQFVKDFRTYPHSSYRAFIKKDITRLHREEVFEWYGGEATFRAYHNVDTDFDEAWCKANWIESNYE
jgi:putative transposase